jgi:CysZ protein
MFQSVKAFSEGLSFHYKGFELAFRHRSLLLLSLVPFIVTLTLYMLAFYWLTLRADDLLNAIWGAGAPEIIQTTGWLHWVYTHVVKYMLYLVLLMIMTYSFCVFSTIVGSPLYDHISSRYELLLHGPQLRGERDRAAMGRLVVIKEEIKKAFIILFIPLFLFFVPIIGNLISLLIAPILIAWDYVDFSLSRDHAFLKDRLAVVWQHKFRLLGFGFPLLIPLIGILLLPFAILGATRLYFERIKPGI